MRDGEVVYITKTGAVSGKPVSKLNKIKFLGFPTISCDYIKIQKGVPEKDDIIFVSAHGTSNFIGNFILSKSTKEKVRIEDDTDWMFVDKFFNELPKEISSIAELLDKFRKNLSA